MTRSRAVRPRSVLHFANVDQMDFIFFTSGWWWEGLMKFNEAEVCLMKAEQPRLSLNFSLTKAQVRGNLKAPSVTPSCKTHTRARANVQGEFLILQIVARPPHFSRCRMGNENERKRGREIEG